MNVHETAKQGFKYANNLSMKSCNNTLTEYEVLALEAVSNMIAQYAKNVTVMLRREERDMLSKLEDLDDEDKKNQEEKKPDEP